MAGFIDIRNATNNYRYLGQIGNCIFIICSAYFLLDSKELNIKKVINIIFDTFIISIIIMILYIISGHNITFKEMIKCIFPITFNNNWFIGCYILYYMIHPILNKCIQFLDKKQLLRVNIFIFLYFYIWQFIKRSTYTDIMGFIALYFIVAYLKKYMNNFRKNIRINIYILISSILGLLFILLILNFLGLNISLLYKKMQYMAIIINPIIVMISLSIFNLFLNKKFYDKKINYISSLTLLIYIIHDNILIRNYLKSWYYSNIFIKYGYTYINFVVLLTAFMVLIVSIFLASIYKETIQKISRLTCDRIYKCTKRIINKIEEIIIKIN